ncbi:MAG: DUF3617 family protein [Terriglobales bacterium]
MTRAYAISGTCLLALLGLGLSWPATPQGTVVPLNVKTGLWESHSSITTAGALGLPPEVIAQMTPQQRAKYEAASSGTRAMEDTSQGCLRPQDLINDPSRFVNPDGKMNCKGEVLTSTASDLDIHVTCSGEAQLDYRIKVHAVDSEHATGAGAGKATMGGRTMQSGFKMESHWLGANCPAGSTR